MLKLLLIGLLFLNPCLAVDLKNDPVKDIKQQLASTDNVIARWIELHRQIYDEFSSPKLNPMQIKANLLEMSSIEQTEAYRVGLRPLMEIKGFRSSYYQHLIDYYRDQNILKKQYVTITNILLRTFDYDINDCTLDYFELYEEIYKTFKKSPVAELLVENRRLQFKNCWQRLMESMVASSLILGSELRSNLNELTKYVFPHQTEILIPSIDSTNDAYQEESLRIGKMIGNFLKNHIGKQTKIDYRHEFKFLIEHPCEMLIETTINVMKHIYAVLKFADNKKNECITLGHTLLLNRYMLCDRILTDSEYMISIVMQFTKIISAYPIMSPSYQKLLHNLGKRKSLNLLQSDDYRHRMNSRNSFNNLITQHEQAEKSDIDGHNPNQIDTTKHYKNGKTIIKIERRVGMGVKTKYPTTWSDGTKTMETRAFLQAFYPNDLKNFIRNQIAETRARFIRRNLTKSAESNVKGQVETVEQLPPSKRQMIQTKQPTNKENTNSPIGTPDSNSSSIAESSNANALRRATNEVGNSGSRHIIGPARVSQVDHRNMLIANWLETRNRQQTDNPARFAPKQAGPTKKVDDKGKKD